MEPVMLFRTFAQAANALLADGQVWCPIAFMRGSEFYAPHYPAYFRCDQMAQWASESAQKYAPSNSARAWLRISRRDRLCPLRHTEKWEELSQQGRPGLFVFAKV